MCALSMLQVKLYEMLARLSYLHTSMLTSLRLISLGFDKWLFKISPRKWANSKSYH